MGEFNATDPEGGSIFYSLVDGNGSSDNHLFTFDDSGSLHNSVIFDYENNASSYSIRVQAKDEYNATTEGNFIVTLLDVYEPSRERPFRRPQFHGQPRNDLGGARYFYHG